jgi:hypothetical protein
MITETSNSSSIVIPDLIGNPAKALPLPKKQTLVILTYKE